MKIFFNKYRSRIKALFLPSILACGMLYISNGNVAFSIENKEQTPKIIQKSNKSYFQISEYTSFENFEASNRNNKAFSDLNLMFPVMEGKNSVIFGDIHGSFFNDTFQNFSAGLGLRFKPEKKKDFIFGLNAYIDYKSTPINFNFYQLGFGAEILHKKFEMRTNFYTTISDDYFLWKNKDLKDILKINEFKVEDNKLYAIFDVGNGDPQIIKEEKAFNEIDYEIGYSLNKNLTIYGGGFYAWNANFDENFAGSKAKIKISGNPNEKTEIYGMLESKNNIRNFPGKSKAEIKASGHVRIKLNDKTSKKKKIHQLKKAHKNKIYLKTIEGLEKIKYNDNLLEKPVFRHSEIELQSKTKIIEIADPKREVLGIGSQTFNSYANIESEFTQENIPENGENQLFFFNLESKNSSDISINKELTFEKNVTFLGDTSKCLDSSLCNPVTNLYPIKTNLGVFDTKINMNGDNSVQFKVGGNAAFTFNRESSILGGDISPTNLRYFELPSKRIAENKTLFFFTTNLKGSGPHNINSGTKKNIKYIADTTGPITFSNIAFNDSIIEIKNASSIDINNNSFEINSSESYPILDTISTPKGKFTITNNSFRGLNSYINIRGNTDIGIVNKIVSQNRIDGTAYSDTENKNPLNYIEFINPVIPPILNSETLTFKDTNNSNKLDQSVYPSIFVFDKSDSNKVLKTGRSMENIFADSNNITSIINGTSSSTTNGITSPTINIIQFIGKNSSNATDAIINLSGNINFKDNDFIFGIGKDNLNVDANNANYEVNYKIFTTENNANSNLQNINPIVQNLNTLNFNKPTIKITSGTKINFGSQSSITGLNFDLFGVSSNNVFNFNKQKQDNILKNNFNNYKGSGSEAKGYVNLINIVDIIGAGSVNGASHKFTNNSFSFSDSASFANLINYEDKTNYDFKPDYKDASGVEQKNGGQLNKSLFLENNQFSMSVKASQNNNNFIYIKPDTFSDSTNPTNINNNKPRLITQEIEDSIKKNYANENEMLIAGASKDVADSKRLKIFSRDLIDYLQNNPFTAYFQFNPSDVYRIINPDTGKLEETTITDLKFNELNNFRYEPAVGDQPAKTTLNKGDYLIKNIPTGNALRGTSIFTDNLATQANGANFGINDFFTKTDADSLPTQGATTKTIVQANVTSFRFSDWQNFDKLIKIDILAGDNLLNTKISNELTAAGSSDGAGNYLLLLDSGPTNKTIRLDNSSEFLKANQYLVGNDYKFWVSTQNESGNQVLNDIVNKDKKEFSHDSLKINVNLQKDATAPKSIGFKPLLEMKENMALIGLNLNLSVEESVLLKYPRVPDVSLINDSKAYINQRKNSFIVSKNLSSTSESSGKQLIQDNKFTLNSGNIDIDKDYLNIFEFVDICESCPTQLESSAPPPQGPRSIIYQLANTTGYRYKIYNNEFNFEKSKQHGINSSNSFCATIKNKINFSGKNLASGQSLANVDFMNIQGINTGSSQYTLFNNLGAKNNNLIFSGSSSLLGILASGNSLSDHQINNFKKNHNGIVSFENRLNGSSNLSLDNYQFDEISGYSGINIIEYPNGISEAVIIPDFINILTNSKNKSFTINAGIIYTGSSTDTKTFPDNIALVSTNKKQQELSIEAFGGSSGNKFPARLIFHGIDTALDIVESENFTGSTIGNFEFPFNFSDTSDAIIALGRSNVISGIDIKSVPTYKFTDNCSNIGSISLTTCSNCLNPLPICTVSGQSSCCAISGSSYPGCCNFNEKLVISNGDSSYTGDKFIFKFQDDVSKIQNADITLTIDQPSNIELSNKNSNSDIGKNNDINIIPKNLLKENSNWELLLKTESSLDKKYYFNNLIKIDGSKNIVNQINNAEKNSVIIIENDLVLNHGSKLDLKDKILISPKAAKNLKFIGKDEKFNNMRQYAKSELAKQPKISISGENGEKIFLSQPLIEINENTILNDLNFNINASSIDPSKKNSLFQFNISNPSAAPLLENLKITNNNFNINLSGGLKLFDNQAIKSENIKNNQFSGSLQDKAFFFDYNFENLHDLSENYLQFNLMNDNKISNHTIEFDDVKFVNNALELESPVIFNGKEFSSIADISSEKDFSNLGEKHKKTLFFAKNHLDIINQNINLGGHSNAIVGSNENQDNFLNLKIKPLKSLGTNKLNLNLKLDAKNINIINNQMPEAMDSQTPIISGTNYELHDVNFEWSPLLKKPIFGGKPLSITNNIFNINNQENEKNILKKANDIFSLKEIGVFDESCCGQGILGKIQYKSNHLIFK